MRPLLAWLAAAAATGDPKVIPKDACEASLPVPEQFDLVITWWASPEGRKFAPGAGAAGAGGEAELRSSALERRAALQNFNEVQYALRSYAQNGMLQFVRRVYILADAATVESFGRPTSLDFGGSALDLRLLTDQDLGLDQSSGSTKHPGSHSCSVKLAALARLEDLTAWFVHVPDDLLLVGKFSRDLFFPQSGPPVMHTYGTYQDWCDGQSATGSRHGPTVFNQCYLGLVADAYDLDHPTPAERDQDRDTICLYYHAAINSGVAQKGAGYEQDNFFRECHTNGGCSLAQAEQIAQSGIIFLDLQGPGISDEYGGDQSRALAFYRKFWPQAEPWELAQPPAAAAELRSAVVVQPDGSLAQAPGAPGDSSAPAPASAGLRADPSALRSELARPAAM